MLFKDLSISGTQLAHPKESKFTRLLLAGFGGSASYSVGNTSGSQVVLGGADVFGR